MCIKFYEFTRVGVFFLGVCGRVQMVLRVCLRVWWTLRSRCVYLLHGKRMVAAGLMVSTEVRM